MPYLDIAALDRNEIRQFTDDAKCPVATENDILVVCDGSRSGLLLKGKNGVVGSTLAVIDSPGFLKPYLKILFTRSFHTLNSSMKGVAIPHLDTSKLINTVTAIPPLEEQKRIVNKVDQLMALCDELEKQQQKQRERRVRLNNAVLDKLLTSQDPEEFAMHWQRICNNFDLLYDNVENVTKLRKAILQLAVQGKLVPQDPNDEPASVQLEKIKAEKERLIKEGKIKKEKPLPPIKKEETPFDIPQEWEWARIGELASAVDYGTSFKSTSLDDGVPIIRMGNVQGGKVLLENLKYVPEYIDDLPKLFLSRNDLLFNRTNSAELVGKSGIFKGLDNKYTFASYLIRISFAVGNTSSDFVNLAMNAPYYRNTQIEPELTQQCGQANFNGTKLKFTLIPLPPTNEQMQIVAKVDKLMTLCDELEAKITRSQSTSQKLMEAVVREVVRQ